eukprot:364470-Chlamydomonas_euryale.AAC.3
MRWHGHTLLGWIRFREGKVGRRRKPRRAVEGTGLATAKMRPLHLECSTSGCLFYSNAATGAGWQPRTYMHLGIHYRRKRAEIHRPKVTHSTLHVTSQHSATSNLKVLQMAAGWRILFPAHLKICHMVPHPRSWRKLPGWCEHEFLAP